MKEKEILKTEKDKVKQTSCTSVQVQKKQLRILSNEMISSKVKIVPPIFQENYSMDTEGIEVLRNIFKIRKTQLNLNLIYSDST